MKTIKQKLIRVALLLALTIPLMAASCGNRATTHNLAIFTAQADAGLTAVTDGVARLAEAGRIKPEVANKIYLTNLKATNGLDVLRSRAKSGFDKKEALVIIDNLISDARKAEADGVLGLSGDAKDRFLKITFFAQFTLRSIKAIIEAIPPPTDTATAEASARSALAVRAQQDGTVGTDLVLILQTALLKGISISQMTQDDAFAEGVRLHNLLVENLRSKGVGTVN